MKLDKNPTGESYLDEAVEESFPASDPISVSHAYSHARQKQTEADKPANPDERHAPGK